jgi:hypothetical protein
MDVLSVDRLLQALQLALQATGARKVAVEEQRLKPAVEILDAPLALGPRRGNENGFDPEA